MTWRIDASGRLGLLLKDQRGTTSLEFALLMAAIVVPMLQVFRVALNWLVVRYQMETFLNGWPFP